MTNQEILFRGFHPCEDGNTTIYVEGEAVKGRWVEGGYSYCESDKTQFIVLMGKDHISHIGWHREVLLSTVCQYTGLTDKNGVKIFEGDMVISPYIDPIFRSYISNDGEKCLNNAPLPITYEQGTFCIDYSREGKGVFSLNAFCSEKDIEIIGTIFDKLREDTQCHK